MLGARPTFYKFLLINLITAIVQASVFFLTAGSALSNGYAPSLANCFNYLQYPWMAALFGIWVLFAAHGMERKSKVGYTIGRLMVSEKVYTLLMAAYYALCFFVFWALQLAAVIIIFSIYGAICPSYVNHQTFFLLSYNTPFIHSLLPLAEITRLFRNIILFLSLGIGASCASTRSRHGSTDVMAIILLIATVIFFAANTGSAGNDTLLMIGAGLASALEISMLLRGDSDEKVA